jgi:lipopolysaccharide transport system ATP-binding protein
MSDEAAIEVSAVSKLFHRRNTLRSLATQVFGMTPGPDAFWAVRDLSFSVRKGECLGIIGPNGSGKTTTLRLLAGVTRPTGGSIRVKGRIGTLIDVRAGFHPELTGRENIYLGGAICGMSRREVRRKFDRIVEFAELGEALDMPVKKYSSGMFVRLGFSVAAHVEPDVLLIDEVLAVGDEGFRAKCYNYIADTLPGAAVVFVSHSMAAISRICGRVVVLSEGRLAHEDHPAAAISRYLDGFGQTVRPMVSESKAHLSDLRLSGADGRDAASDGLEYGKPFGVSFSLEVPPEHERFNVSLSVMTAQQELVAQCHSEWNGHLLQLPGGRGRIECRFGAMLLNPGRYHLSVVIYDRRNAEYLCWHHAAIGFRVAGKWFGSGPVQAIGEWTVAPRPAGGP